MLASPGKAATVADTDRWRYEGKWDGIRALARFDGELTITSRTGRNITALYPELAELAELLDGHRAVIDGEIVVLDENGRSVFNLMQDRMNLSRPADVQRVRKTRPVLFWVFDVLWLDGVSLLSKPFDLRRTVLEAMPLDGAAVSVPELLDLPLDEALAVTRERGWEGVIAKRRDSPYQPGKRKGHWVKLKHQSHQEVVLVGWTAGTGRRADTIGALVLALPDGDGWRYVGKVGTGFTDPVLDDLLARLTPLRRKDTVLTGEVPREVVRESTWVDPVLVGEIGYAEWTRDGVVRFPVWRGLRHDKTPADVVAE